MFNCVLLSLPGIRDLVYWRERERERERECMCLCERERQ